MSVWIGQTGRKVSFFRHKQEKQSIFTTM